MYKAIVNANIVTPNGIVFDGTLVIENNRIYDILTADKALPVNAEIIDAKGAYIGPGFVDIHVHGFGSGETFDADAGTVDHFLSHGTTTLLATPYYSYDFEKTLRDIHGAKEAMKKTPVIKGIYMEGPYTNPDYGANADTNPWRHDIVEAEYKALVDACGTDVKVWTTEPELDGILDFCAYAKKINPDVVIALGHSEATPQLIDAMGKYRPTLMTHTMNATGRLPVVGGTRGYGPDEYCFSHPEMYAELISDSCGIHVNAVLQVYDKVYYTDVDSIQMITKTVPVKLNVPEPHEVPLAKQYKELHESGRDCDIPYTAMELTTVVAEALRICKYEKSPPYLDLTLLGLKIGPVALVGIPGEPFTEVGAKIKETAGFALILPCALTNGYEGYFPVKAAYDEGGYEARSSRYKSGVAETIIEGGKHILSELSHI